MTTYAAPRLCWKCGNAEHGTAVCQGVELEWHGDQWGGHRPRWVRTWAFDNTEGTSRLEQDVCGICGLPRAGG